MNCETPEGYATATYGSSSLHGSRNTSGDMGMVKTYLGPEKGKTPLFRSSIGFNQP